MELFHIVSAQEAGMTLHQLMRGPMGLSGRQTRLLKQEGAVTVNAAPFFSNQRLEEGMVVRACLPGYENSIPAAQDAPGIDVLYEDEALIAVSKPALLQCHPSPSAPRSSDTLESRVSAYLGQSVHPVHRLDAETTGIVLFAKLPYAQAHLQRQMQEGSFQKAYQAWVYGRPSPEEGVIDAPIDRLTPDSFTRIVTPGGQRAVSRYRVISTHAAPVGQSLSLLELSPVTGRTHQLRVHMTHIGCPLLGDARYYTQASKAFSDSAGLTYHQLAAVSLCFVHPISGGNVRISCKPVFDFIP